MPCSDGGPSYQENPETKDRLDKVTRLLCGLCRRLTNRGRAFHITDDAELAKWWAAHQEEDRRREERERKEREEAAAKRKALAKLSPRERRLLGIRERE